MPILDPAAMARSLDNDYGPPPAEPLTHELALFFGDPQSDGVELTEAGRVTIATEDWLPATADGIKATADLVQMPDATAPYLATHFALYGSDGHWWDCAELDDPIDVSEAGPGPQVLVELFYDDSTQEG